MFGVKRQFRDYLEVIRAWAMGVDNRGWMQEDFQIQVEDSDVFGGVSWRDREDVKQYRTDPSHVIFPIRPYEITVLDRLFLNQKQFAALVALNQSITSFNATLDAVNRSTDIDTRWGRLILLHVGLIGRRGTGGLHDVFNHAVETLPREGK